MNLLVDSPPETVTIGETSFLIRTDFRISILFESAMLDPDITEEEKLEAALSLYYPDIPQDIPLAVEKALEFYRCGRSEKAFGGNAKAAVRTYDFEEDDRYIFAAFLTQYGIDLTSASLHWWKFRAMFHALSSDTMFMKIVGWRGAEIDSKAPPEEKKRLRELKKLYALPERRNRDEAQKYDEITQILMGSGDLSQVLGK